MNDLTIIYYSSNSISDHFFQNTKKRLLEVAGSVPIISVTQKPVDFGDNLVVGDIGASHVNIYRQALIGAKAAKTKYIGMAEDDVLYSEDHFTAHRPRGKFAYDMNIWLMYTWTEPMFSYKGRINLYSLICERDLFIETMEERFEKYPDHQPIHYWAEPGKYEKSLGVTVQEKEEFWAKRSSVAFSHSEALSFKGLGTRKRLGGLRAKDTVDWGTAESVMKLYEDPSL